MCVFSGLVILMKRDVLKSHCDLGLVHFFVVLSVFVLRYISIWSCYTSWLTEFLIIEIPLVIANNAFCLEGFFQN